MKLIGGHLTRLVDFTGRENRQPFWLWVLIVYAVQFVLGMIVMIPMMAGAMARMTVIIQQHDQTYLNQHPEVASQVMLQTMAPAMQSWMTAGIVMMVILFALIASAVVRRLQDGDRSGWWAAPVALSTLATLAANATMFPRFFQLFPAMRPGMTPDQMNAAMAPAMQSMAWVSLLGMANLLVTIVLVVFLALPGTAGPNRFGDDPLERLPGLSSWRASPTSQR